MLWKALLFCAIIVYVKCVDPYEEFTQFKEEYTLPPLPYSYDGLEPHIDKATLRVHHLGHHAAYTKKMNAALADWRESVNVHNMTPENLMKSCFNYWFLHFSGTKTRPCIKINSRNTKEYS